MLGVVLSLLALVLDAIVHDAALATLSRSPNHLARFVISVVSVLVASWCILLLENACAPILNPRRLPIISLLLRHFLVLLIATLASRRGLVTLLLHFIRLLALVARTLVPDLARHSS